MYMVSFCTKLGEVSKPYASLQEAVKIARRQATLMPRVRVYVHKVGVSGLIYFDGLMMTCQAGSWWATVLKNRNSLKTIDTSPSNHNTHAHTHAHTQCSRVL